MAVDEKAEASIRFDLFELDARGCQLRRSGVVVDLPGQALKVLTLLTARPNELVTRKEIKETLWPNEAHGDFDSRMNFAVKRLREALGDSAEQPRYVQTVRNAGYVFIAPVRTVEASVQAATNSNGSDNPFPSNGNGVGAAQMVLAEAVANARPSGVRFGLSGLMVGIFVIVAMLAFGAFVMRPRDTRAAVQSEPARKEGLKGVDGVPEIFSVSPIIAQARQRIVISGRGFGLHAPYSRTDSPHLAIRDETRDWSAGRMIPENWDEVMLDIESWNTNEIVLSGFSGDYGQKGWNLIAGDWLEVRVWNPQTGFGPARFQLTVSSADAAK